MARYPIGLFEEELKNKVAADWFAAYDTTRIIGKVDFCVAIPVTELALYEAENALWAEAKAGVRKDIHESFVQLILDDSGLRHARASAHGVVYKRCGRISSCLH